MALLSQVTTFREDCSSSPFPTLSETRKTRYLRNPPAWVGHGGTRQRGFGAAGLRDRLRIAGTSSAKGAGCPRMGGLFLPLEPIADASFESGHVFRAASPDAVVAPRGLLCEGFAAAAGRLVDALLGGEWFEVGFLWVDLGSSGMIGLSWA